MNGRDSEWHYSEMFNCTSISVSYMAFSSLHSITYVYRFAVLFV
jgi:hypothetical protein